VLAFSRIVILSDPEYDSDMKGITIKLSEMTLRRLRQEAHTTGRTVAALVRDRVEGIERGRSDSVYSLTSDLAGSLAGPRRSATNDRRRFRKS
jgi:hypothetical protein